MLADECDRHLVQLPVGLNLPVGQSTESRREPAAEPESGWSKILKNHGPIFDGVSKWVVGWSQDTDPDQIIMNRQDVSAPTRTGPHIGSPETPAFRSPPLMRGSAFSARSSL